MIRFEKLSATENAYPFEDAVVAANYKNGTFGTVSSGTFTAGAGFKAIMQVEDGDNANTDSYEVPTGSHARIADFSKSNGQVLNVTANQLPASFAVGNKLVADSYGKLKVEANPDGNYFSVIEKTKYGARVGVVVVAEEIDLSDYVNKDQLGVANGVATLDGTGKLTTAQRPE